uniref:Uncharacterized protein n=1 Tax=Peronospora matthiolae TaxID=2874970 RepID=A0AAV1UFA7_9STRA
MEEFFQYIGPDNGAVLSSTLLNQNRLFVYSSPCEKHINRCGHLPVGSYFACSTVLYYDDNVWLKIRRGYFSNTQHNGYIRVYFASPSTSGVSLDGSDLPSRQYAAVTEAQPVPFRHMRRLPAFPTYMCARDRLMLYREPVFTLHSTSMSSMSSSSSAGGNDDRATTLRPLQRFVPPVSVFRATECRFNEDFTQLAIKVIMAGAAGVSGWINASFHKTLIEVEDPCECGVFRNGPVYLQNVAERSGKWVGELPVRAIPNLQAPRLYGIESYRVVRAIERKLLKDRVWIRIEPLVVQQKPQGGVEEKSEINDGNAKTGDDQEQNRRANGDTVADAKPDAWVIERNANTAQRVMVPWASTRIRDAPSNDDAERYYRTVYSRRPLPLRRTADLQAEIVGHLDPGSVFVSTQRILNEKGRIWIRVALPLKKRVQSSRSAGDDIDEQNTNSEHDAEESSIREKEFSDSDKLVQYGYAIQSNAKTNTCMVQEIPSPGKINPKQYYQVSLPTDLNQAQPWSPNQDEEAAGSVPENTLAARAEASRSAKELFYVKNGAILSAIGTVFSAEEGRMWLQVLAAELDPAMKVKLRRVLSDVEQNINVVYLPMCDPNRNSHECVLLPIHRELTRIDNPLNADKDGSQSPSRVVFSGRASKLFGSHLLRPSTIDLPSPFHGQNKKAESHSSGITAHDPAAGENDRAQSLKDEITAWQLQTGNRMSQLYSQLGSLAGYTISCVSRPFASCLAHQEARRRYQQLEQDGEGMEEYALEDEDDNM